MAARSPARSRFPAFLAAAALLALVAALLLVARPWKAGGLFAPAAVRPAATRAPSTASSSSATELTTAPPPAAAPVLRGRILDADGNPVNGATVRVVTPAAPLAVYADTRSDAQGGFAFAHVETGSGERAPRVRAEADRDPEGAVTSAVFTVTEGDTKEITLVLAPAVVRGTVVDAEEHAVGGAVLTLEGLPWSIPSAQSAEDGTFKWGAIPDGATSVFCVARGYRAVRVGLPAREGTADVVVHVRLGAASPIDGDVQDPDGKPLVAQVVACEGQPSEAKVESGQDGSFQLPASTIGCTAVARHYDFGSNDPVTLFEGKHATLQMKAGGVIEGVVVDETGAPVTSYTIGVESYAGEQRGGGGRGHKVDDPAGAFRFDKLAPGSYTLTAGAPPRPPTRSDPVSVAAGATTSGIRVVLAVGGAVVGHVFDEKHAPIEGVELHFDAVSSIVKSDAQTRTDGAGAYRLEGAPSGPFTLLARKDGFRTRLVSGLRVASKATLTQDIVLHAPNGSNFEFAGIGAGLEMTRDGLSFTSIAPDNPAAKAGLQSGDRIVSIDGESTDGMSDADAVQRLRGEQGTSVGVSVRRAKTNETVDVVVERAQITR